MVIQRIQTLFLLIAIIIVAALMWLPFAFVGETAVNMTEFPMLIILDVVIAVLLVVSIFLFKNLRLQMQVTAINICLTLFTIVAMLICSGLLEQASVNYIVCSVVPVAAAIFELLAYRGMKRDRRLLSSMDRLR